MKLISIVTPCYNEESNVLVVYERVKQLFQDIKKYRYEHIFIDNASTDRTTDVIKSIIAEDKNIRLIVNSRNFGQVRSPFHAFLQAHGDAVITLVCDLQDPPELIIDFLKKWEQGFKIVVGVKDDSAESKVMFKIRRFYYEMITKIAETPLIQNFMGFGLYDRMVVEALRGIDDPYPYFRGLISEVGFDVAQIRYRQATRAQGKTSNNFYSLYEIAALGITNHTKIPLRLAIFSGFVLAALSMLVSLAYLVLKLLFWEQFGMGLAPLIIGMFFFAAVQLFFIGLLGEYVLAILTQVRKRPLVVEKERVNF